MEQEIIIDNEKAFAKFANELTNQMKHLSAEKFDRAKLDVVEKQFSYFIDRVKANDVDMVMYVSLFVNVFRLYLYNNSLDVLGIVLDNVFKEEVIRGIRNIEGRDENGSTKKGS